MGGCIRENEEVIEANFKELPQHLCSETEK
jgi:hypothetical protein